MLVSPSRVGRAGPVVSAVPGGVFPGDAHGAGHCTRDRGPNAVDAGPGSPIGGAGGVDCAEARVVGPDRGGQAVTWTKLSEDFPEDCARVGLSDAAVRTHLEGLVWAMRRENDGRLCTRDLGRLADTSDPTAAAAELVAVGFWTQLPDGWQIEHQMEHQPESDVIAARRELNAERQRRKRRKAAGLPDPDPDKDSLSWRDNTRDDQRDNTRDPERSGTARNRKYLGPPLNRTKTGHLSPRRPLLDSLPPQWRR